MEGFCLGIPQHYVGKEKWYTPDNHASAKELYQKFGFFRSNPMGGATNGDGSIRLINDLSFPKNDKEIPSVNSFVDKMNYETSWDDFKRVAKFFRDNPGAWELAVFDWAKAYRQLPVHHSQRKYLIIKDFRGRLWVDLAVGFGGVASCGVFGAPAETWKQIMISQLELPAIFRWVDDNLMLRRKGEKTSLKDVTYLSNLMGVKTNPRKNHEFAEEQKFLGSREICRSKATRLIPPDVEDDLNKWEICLSEFDACPLVPNPVPEEVGWVGDAASTFGIGVLVGEFWACFKFVKEWEGKGRSERKRRIAWAETVAIRLGLLVLEKTTNVKGRRFWVHRDWVVISSRNVSHLKITGLMNYRGVDSGKSCFGSGRYGSKFHKT